MLLLVLFFSLQLGWAEFLDRCEVSYKRCIFECVQKFPLDRDKRKGCESRCKLEKGVCEVKDKLNRFWEGFSGGG